MRKRVFYLVVLISCLTLVACSDSPVETNEDKTASTVNAGEYYSFISGDGDFKVLKVLCVEGDLIHVCYYNNVFTKKPSKEVVSSLFFGKRELDGVLYHISDSQQTTGRRHVALISENWENWKPELLSTGEVTADELIGYNDWKNGKREVMTFTFVPTN